jgi:hypothetical protein
MTAFFSHRRENLISYMDDAFVCIPLDHVIFGSVEENVHVRAVLISCNELLVLK